MISVIFKLNNLRYIYINKEEKYYSRHISFSVEPSIHATPAFDEIQLKKSCLYSFIPFFDMQSLHFFVFLFIFLFSKENRLIFIVLHFFIVLLKINRVDVNDNYETILVYLAFITIYP